jgi:hypothetical protein
MIDTKLLLVSKERDSNSSAVDSKQSNTATSQHTLIDAKVKKRRDNRCHYIKLKKCSQLK